MKLSKILIGIGLILTAIGTIIVLSMGGFPLIWMLVLGLSIWIFKQENVRKYGQFFTFLGIIFIVVNIASGSISIDGLLYLIGGILATKGK
ncbi:hypothetical protein RJG79_05710 [Mycoplasmatota bacterium WC44]